MEARVWQHDLGHEPVGPEWDDVKFRKNDPSWPDMRYRRGREMLAHFNALAQRAREVPIRG